MPSIITEYPQFFTATNLEWKKLLRCVVGDCPALGYRHEHQQRQKNALPKEKISVINDDQVE